MFVFGGNEGVWEFLPLNDLWAFDLGTTLAAPVPPALEAHTSAYRVSKRTLDTTRSGEH